MIEVHVDILVSNSPWGAEHGSIPFGPSTLSAVLSSTFVARSRGIARSPDIGAACSGVAMFPGAEDLCLRRFAVDHSQMGMVPAQVDQIIALRQDQV